MPGNVERCTSKNCAAILKTIEQDFTKDQGFHYIYLMLDRPGEYTAGIYCRRQEIRICNI
jgi:hypothetical protein